MKLGIMVQGYVRSDSSPQERVNEAIAEARLADELGLASFGVSEQHFKYPTNSTGPIDVILAAVAQCTEQIRITPGVVILPLHHPLNVAERWAGVDILSKGRLYFGVGKGNTPLTADVFKVPMRDTDAITNESLDVIIRAWTQERFSFEGRFFNFPEIGLCPRPWQKPHPPIGWAGSSDQTAEFSGGRQMGFMTGATAIGWSELEDRLAIHDRAWTNGKPLPGAKPYRYRSLLVHGHVANDLDAVRDQVASGVIAYVNRYIEHKRTMMARAGHSSPDFGAEFIDNFDKTVTDTPSVFGSPEECIPNLLRMKKIGFDQVDIVLDYARHEDILEAIRLIAVEIAPAVKEDVRPREKISEALSGSASV